MKFFAILWIPLRIIYKFCTMPYVVLSEMSNGHAACIIFGQHQRQTLLCILFFSLFFSLWQIYYYFGM